MAHIVKDPIYGYIRIEDDHVWRVIDSPAFQRLRYIAQTSYAPLFPSAVHNRFVHSLGVYRLGHFVAKIIEDKSLPAGNEDAVRAFLKVFELACLLHDIGHAPFSHTGETLTTREWVDRLHVSRCANSASASGRAFPQSDFSWKTATRAMCPLRTSSDRVLPSHDWH